jgi:hypothetical protein
MISISIWCLQGHIASLIHWSYSTGYAAHCCAATEYSSQLLMSRQQNQRSFIRLQRKEFRLAVPVTEIKKKLMEKLPVQRSACKSHWWHLCKRTLRRWLCPNSWLRIGLQPTIVSSYSHMPLPDDLNSFFDVGIGSIRNILHFCRSVNQKSLCAHVRMSKCEKWQFLN